VFQYKDHLGNIRLSYTKNAQNGLEIIDETHYYPFGLKHEGYVALQESTNKYKFQGQERQDELGLNWDSFKYRNYDMAIGRFMSVDPLAEKYPYNSTYAFQENKMGMGKELEGLELAPFPWLEVALGSSDVIKLSTEVGGKTSEVGGKFSEVDFVGEEHHVIPRGVKGNEVVKDAISEGFKFEGAENKISVEKFSRATGNGRHGNHPSYNKGVLDKLGEFGKATEGSKTTEGSSALEFLRNLTQELKETIKNNPDKKINDLLKSEIAPVKRDNTSVKKPEPPKQAPKQKPKPGEIWT
jgi:RHS repeat-associated protein